MNRKKKIKFGRLVSFSRPSSLFSFFLCFFCLSLSAKVNLPYSIIFVFQIMMYSTFEIWKDKSLELFERDGLHKRRKKTKQTKKEDKQEKKCKNNHNRCFTMKEENYCYYMCYYYKKIINFLFQHLLIFIFRMFTLSFCTYKVIIYATCPMLLFPNFVFFFLFQKDLFVYVGISNYHRNNSCSKRNCKTILYNSFCVFVIGHN